MLQTRVSEAFGCTTAGPCHTDYVLQEKSTGELEEKLARMIRALGSYGHKLPDAGAKLRASLENLLAELERRGIPRAQAAPSLFGPSAGASSREERKARKGKKKKRGHADDSSKVELGEVVFLDDDDDEDVQKVDSELYYPSRDDPEAIVLTKEDLRCLEPEEFLSSSVLNFYIQYIKKRNSHSGGLQGRFHIFNTFFYCKLEEAFASKGVRDSKFPKLRRWWKGINIFHKAYVLMPIHVELHWSLIIICNPAKDSEIGPLILHMDSLGLHPSTSIFSIVGSFLEEEQKHMPQSTTLNNLPFIARIWNNLSTEIRYEKVNVPQQKNLYDCGTFVLYYIERFVKQAPERLGRQDLGMFGRRWFKPEQASRLRRRLRELLHQEFEKV